jgi:hypothetical protein
MFQETAEASRLRIIAPLTRAEFPIPDYLESSHGVNDMRIALIAFSAVFALAAPVFADGPMPCEKMLSDLREAEKTAQVSDADKAKVAELRDKGIERCNADDDERADNFFAEALKILGK